MIFNSLDFAIFLPIVFFLYWFVAVKNFKLQNILIVVSSYVFYGWWDWRFLALIVFSTFTDYFVGILLQKNNNNNQKRKVLLWISVIVNIAFLGFFKYCNFFIDSFVTAFSFFGLKISGTHLNIILPVGISFYTFQTMSYSIDIYYRKMEPTKDFIGFAAFVSFFPQLVAGPIERATNLLPQFYTKKHFSYDNAIEGCRQILWGLFKKVVIADNCARYVNNVFNDYGNYSGSTLVLAAIFFTFQIYCDFSGYSDIAIGVSRLFDFKLMRNFNFPYFSRDVAEFWRRWHISLTTWFRDYIYFPLGGSRKGLFKTIRNTFIIFIVSGFWHGANWTFIAWGAIHACYFLPLLLSKNNRKNIEIVAKGKNFPTFREVVQILVTFSLTVFAWIFFRAESLTHAFHYVAGIFNRTLFSIPSVITVKMCMIFVIVIIFFLLEWIGREKEFALQQIDMQNKRSIIARWSLYIALIFCILCLGGNSQDFIYFQF